MSEATQSQSQQMQAARLSMRMQREIKLLQTEPPPGVCAWPSHGDLFTHLEAQIEGPVGTVYAKGIFKLQIQVPDRYPFEPPNVRFVTPIYHPNIDNGGRICLDILNLPPKGAWRPSLNIATVLASIGLLISEPNPDDGLMGDISAEYKHNRSTFDKRARLWTQKYAVQTESQNNTLPRETSSLGRSLQNGQGSSETIGTSGQMEIVKEAATTSPNQANIEVEVKDNNYGNPSKSIASLGKRLSLSRESLVQPAKPSSAEAIVMEAKEQFYNANISFEPSQNTVMEDARKLSVKSVLGENLCDKVGTTDLASHMHKAFKGPGRGEGTDPFGDKENLQPRCWNAKNPPPSLSALKGLESGPGTRLSVNGMKDGKKTEKGISHNDTSVPSNRSFTSLANKGKKRHDELVDLDALKLKTHEIPISRSCQPEKENLEENTEGRLNVGTLKEIPTVIVSDSESDEEPVQVRSRLSLSRRASTSTGKRKATCIG